MTDTVQQRQETPTLEWAITHIESLTGDWHSWNVQGVLDALKAAKTSITTLRRCGDSLYGSLLLETAEMCTACNEDLQNWRNARLHYDMLIDTSM